MQQVSRGFTSIMYHNTMETGCLQIPVSSKHSLGKPTSWVDSIRNLTRIWSIISVPKSNNPSTDQHNQNSAPSSSMRWYKGYAPLVAIQIQLFSITSLLKCSVFENSLKIGFDEEGRKKPWQCDRTMVAQNSPSKYMSMGWGRGGTAYKAQP